MKLKIIKKGRYTVLDVLIEVGEVECPAVLSELHGIDNNYQGLAQGFRALFQRFSEEGPQGLTDKMFHRAGDSIHRFRKGKLRVYCFLDDELNRVVLTHVALKKQQKSDPKDLNRANKVFNSYFDSKKNNKLEIIK